jgi:hypothetical protein
MKHWISFLNFVEFDESASRLHSEGWPRHNVPVGEPLPRLHVMDLTLSPKSCPSTEKYVELLKLSHSICFRRNCGIVLIITYLPQ